MAGHAAATLHQNDIERPGGRVAVRVVGDSEHAVHDDVLSASAQGRTAHSGEAPHNGLGYEAVPPAAVRRAALARRRREVCKTQEVLAAETGVHRTTVARWESGETVPSLWVRPLIANALHISIDVLNALLGAVPVAVKEERQCSS